MLHDLYLRKTAPPQTKYNGAQRIAYTAIIIMGIGSILTGLAVYKPVQLNWLCALFGGYKMSRIIHFALTIGYVLFFIIHLLQVIRAGWNNFRAMVTGFEVVKINDSKQPEQVVAPAHEPETAETDDKEENSENNDTTNLKT